MKNKTQMRIHFFNLLLATLLIIMGGNVLLAMDAGEILNRMGDVLFASEDQTSTVKMILTDRNGNERRREAMAWQKGSNKHLFRFTAPASEAGIALLSLPDDVIYLYMPAYGRERRIASHMKNQSFAGTDLSYEDLEIQKYAEEFSAILLEQTEAHYVLELTPRPGVQSGYSRIVAYVNSEHYYPEIMKTFDRKGREFKVIEYLFEKKDDYWYAREVFITNLSRDHRTHIVFEDMQFDTGLGDEIFSIRNLTRY